MEFKSYEDVKRFEEERERYYLSFIGLCNSFDPFRVNFYKRIFLDAFHPKYRATKKMYDKYYGGWWRDKNGRPCAEHIGFIDSDCLTDGELCVERNDECIYAFYVFKRGVFHKILPDLLEVKDEEV